MRRCCAALLAVSLGAGCDCSGTKPLTVVVTTPAAAATAGADFPVAAGVQNAIGTATVSFTLGDRTCAADASGPGFAATCTLGDLADGAQPLVAHAKDKSRTAASAPVAINVSRPLAVSITSPAAGTTVAGNFPVTATVTGFPATTATVTFTLTGAACTAALAPPWSGTCDLGATADSTATLVATASGGGRTAASAPISVTISRPLAIAITAPSGGATVTGDFPVTATVTGYPASTATVTYTLGGVACTSALPSPWSGTCALGTVPDGAATLLATASGGGRTATSAPISLTIARPAPTASAAAALEGSVWLERANIPVAVTTANATSVDLLVDGTKIATASSPFSFTIPGYTLLPGLHDLQAVAKNAVGTTAAGPTRHFSVDQFPFGPPPTVLSEMEDARFATSDGRWLPYGANIGADGFGDVYFLRIPGGTPAGPFANAHLFSASSDLVGNFYFWVKTSSVDAFDLATATSTAAPSVLLAAEGAIGNLVASDDGHAVVWGTPLRTAYPFSFSNLYTVHAGARVPVLSSSTTVAGYYARAHSVTAHSSGDVADVADGVVETVGASCSLVDETLFPTGEMMPICGGVARLHKPGAATVSALTACLTSTDRFSNFSNLYLVCDVNNASVDVPGTGNLYYIRDPNQALTPASAIDVSAGPFVDWRVGGSYLGFRSVGKWKAMLPDGTIRSLPEPFETGNIINVLPDDQFAVVVPATGSCGSFQLYDPAKQKVTVNIPCDDNTATLSVSPSSPPLNPDRFFHVVPSSFDSGTRDVYVFTGAGPEHKLFTGLTAGLTDVKVPLDGSRAVIQYTDTATTPQAHVLHAKTDGSGTATEIVFDPGADAAGRLFAGISLDGSTVWYVSGLTNVTTSWTGTLHLAPVDGSPETTYAVGGHSTNTSLFVIAFALQGAAGLAWGPGDTGIAFSGGTSAVVPPPVQAPFLGSTDGKHLYYLDFSSQLQHLDTAARTATLLAPSGPFQTGAWAAYAIGTGGSLLRLPGTSGGPQTLAASGAGDPQNSFPPFADLLEDEGNYCSATVTGGAGYLILGDTCGPGDRDLCNQGYPF